MYISNSPRTILSNPHVESPHVERPLSSPHDIFFQPSSGAIHKKHLQDFSEFHPDSPNFEDFFVNKRNHELDPCSLFSDPPQLRSTSAANALLEWSPNKITVNYHYG